jgi:hypothetical protein
MAELVLDEVGLLPHANAGALHPTSSPRCAPVAPSQGMMIESLNPDLDGHRGSPDKTPERRLATLEAAGELAIPFTTGILVGIGESATTASPRSRPSPLAPPLGPRAGGHRPELPAQAGHRDAAARRARPTTTSTPSRWPA